MNWELSKKTEYGAQYIHEEKPNSLAIYLFEEEELLVSCDQELYHYTNILNMTEVCSLLKKNHP